MAIVTLLPTTHKPPGITYHPYAGDLYGTAELLNGSSYFFRAESYRRTTLVSYTDVNLVLLGGGDLADTQWVAANPFAARWP